MTDRHKSPAICIRLPYELHQLVEKRVSELDFSRNAVLAEAIRQGLNKVSADNIYTVKSPLGRPYDKTK